MLRLKLAIEVGKTNDFIQGCEFIMLNMLSVKKRILLLIFIPTCLVFVTVLDQIKNSNKSLKQLEHISHITSLLSNSSGFMNAFHNLRMAHSQQDNPSLKIKPLLEAIARQDEYKMSLSAEEMAEFQRIKNEMVFLTSDILTLRQDETQDWSGWMSSLWRKKIVKLESNYLGSENKAMESQMKGMFLLERLIGVNYQLQWLNHQRFLSKDPLYNLDIIRRQGALYAVLLDELMNKGDMLNVNNIGTEPILSLLKVHQGLNESSATSMVTHDDLSQQLHKRIEMLYSLLSESANIVSQEIGQQEDTIKNNIFTLFVGLCLLAAFILYESLKLLNYIRFKFNLISFILEKREPFTKLDYSKDEFGMLEERAIASMYQLNNHVAKIEKDRADANEQNKSYRERISSANQALHQSVLKLNAVLCKIKSKDVKKKLAKHLADIESELEFIRTLQNELDVDFNLDNSKARVFVTKSDYRDVIYSAVDKNRKKLSMTNSHVRIDVDKSLPSLILIDRVKLNQIFSLLIQSILKVTPDIRFYIDIKSLVLPNEKIDINTIITVQSSSQNEKFSHNELPSPIGSLEKRLNNGSEELHSCQQLLNLLGSSLMFESVNNETVLFHFSQQCDSVKQEEMSYNLAMTKPLIVVSNEQSFVEELMNKIGSFTSTCAETYNFASDLKVLNTEACIIYCQIKPELTLKDLDLIHSMNDKHRVIVIQHHYQQACEHRDLVEKPIMVPVMDQALYEALIALNKTTTSKSIDGLTAAS